MMTRFLMRGRLVWVGAAAALLLTLALPATEAAAGRGGKSGSGTTSGGASLAAVSNPSAAWGTPVNLSGSGYIASASAYINIHTPLSLVSATVMTDSSGKLAYNFNTLDPGTYSIDVSQSSGGKNSVMGTASLSVY